MNITTPLQLLSYMTLLILHFVVGTGIIIGVSALGTYLQYCVLDLLGIGPAMFLLSSFYFVYFMVGCFLAVDLINKVENWTWDKFSISVSNGIR